MVTSTIVLQVVYGDVYMLDNGTLWKQLSPMPKPDSHIEFAWVVVNNSIIIVGGTAEKHPITKKMILVGEVFLIDLETLVCSTLCVNDSACSCYYIFL